jgi:hypothetical protein
VKKNLWASIYKALKMGLFSYALLLSTFSGITGVTVAHAMSSGCILLFCPPTPTPDPTSAPMPTPDPTSAPTPIATQTSIATQAPIATSSPQVQPNSTRVVLPVSTITMGTLTPVTPTSTPGNATAIAATVTPNQTAVITTDITPTKRQSQDAGDAGGNMFMQSLSIGILIFLLTGGMLWLLWRRQREEDQHKLGLQGISRNAPAAARWVSSRELQSNIDGSQYASSAILAPGVSGGAGVWPMPSSTQPMSSSQSAYASSNPYPMMNTFPQQMFTMSSNNVANYPQNDILGSPLMGSLPLTETRDSNKNGQMSLLTSPPTPLMNTPAQSMSSSLLSPEVSPPSVEDDPMLRAAMQQAQMGLFTLPDR